VANSTARGTGLKSIFLQMGRGCSQHSCRWDKVVANIPECCSRFKSTFLQMGQSYCQHSYRVGQDSDTDFYRKGKGFKGKGCRHILLLLEKVTTNIHGGGECYDYYSCGV
jgi:hypothetical protein